MRVRGALVVVAVGAVLALTLLASGLGGTFRSGFVRITLNDFNKPLAFGLLAVGGLLVRDWRHALWRRLGFGLLTALGLLAVICFARSTPAIITDSDLAVTELYTELATRGRLLVGPYSRFGWNHPGPLYFYVQAPFYAASGHRAAALYGVAVAINVLAIATLTWIVARTNRGPLLVFVTAACVMLPWRAPRLLASPWTGHVAILPGLTFIALCAAIASGRARLLPLAVVMGSFITQTHVGFVPLVGVLSVVAVVLGWRREDARSRWFIVNASAWVAFGLWLLPISEALTGAGGNLSALGRFFVASGGTGHALKDALYNWSYGLVGLFRSDFNLPWGGHFILRGFWWVVPGALGQVLLLVAVARQDFRSGRLFDSSLALFAALASGVGLWAITQIRGDVLDHEIFWLAALGGLNVAILGAAGLRRLARWRLGEQTALSASVLLVMLVAVLGTSHLRGLTSFELRRVNPPAILATYQTIREYLRAERVEKPLVQVEGRAWSHSAGVLLRLLQNRVSFAVPNASLPMFTGYFRSSGDEDALVTISSDQEFHQQMSARPGNVVLQDLRSVYVDAVKIVPVGHVQAR